jgi:hypothetical protein
VLRTTATLVNDGATMLYTALQREGAGCALKSRCCPNTPARKIPRSIHEGARDMARQIARSWEGGTSRRLRKKVEMLFAHLKRILKLNRLRLRGPTGAHDEFLLAATAQNLRKLAKLIPLPTLKLARDQGRIIAAPREDGDPLDLLCFVAGLVQQNRSKCDLRRGARQVCSRP